MSSFKTRAFTYSTIVAMGGFIFGLDAAVISGTVKFLVEEFALTDLQLGTVVSAPVLGVLFALPLAGISCNRLGRKTTLQIVAFLYLISALASALAPTFVFLVVARFVGGLAFSSISLASMYIGEIAPPRWRGKLVSMTQINIVFGLSAAYFLNYLILIWVDAGGSWVQNLGMDSYTWRWMLGVEIIPALLWLGLLAIIPRSPAWLIYVGRKEQARTTLLQIYPENEVETQLLAMERSIEEKGTSVSVATQLSTIFSTPMRVILVIGLTMAIVQQATGINAILFYAPTIIEQLGLGTDTAFAQAIWIGLISILFTFLALLLIDRIGRRIMVLGGLLWIAFSLGMCSYGFYEARYTLTEKAISELNEIDNAVALLSIAEVTFENDRTFKKAIIDVLGKGNAKAHEAVILQKAASLNAPLIFAGILSFIAAFHFSVGPIMWVLFSEIFPISIRGVAIPFFTLISSFTSYLVQQFFPWQLAQFGAATTFLFYAFVVVIGLVILSVYLKETKNMSIEDIQRKLVLV